MMPLRRLGSRELGTRVFVAVQLLALVVAERCLFCRYASEPAAEPGAALQRRADAGRAVGRSEVRIG